MAEAVGLRLRSPLQWREEQLASRRSRRGNVATASSSWGPVGSLSCSMQRQRDTSRHQPLQAALRGELGGDVTHATLQCTVWRTTQPPCWTQGAEGEMGMQAHAGRGARRLFQRTDLTQLMSAGLRYDSKRSQAASGTPESHRRGHITGKISAIEPARREHCEPN